MKSKVSYCQSHRLKCKNQSTTQLGSCKRSFKMICNKLTDLI